MESAVYGGRVFSKDVFRRIGTVGVRVHVSFSFSALGLRVNLVANISVDENWAAKKCAGYSKRT